jgi:hypothetical protein
MIKHIHTDIYAVKVLPETCSVKITNKFLQCFDEKGKWVTDEILPTGSWKYLCLNTTQKEEEAARVVEYNYKPFDPSVIRYENYDSDGWTIGQRYFRTALQSLSSMNKAFELSGTWALIQKEK